MLSRLRPITGPLACLALVALAYHGGGRLAEWRRTGDTPAPPEPAEPRFRSIARGCSPEGECRACRNCSSCRHCAREGGTCSVCR